ncbi:MAG: hypothetical protein FWH26_04805 [Oscillospiraceae bacterium]|nr:hypothetical protein [Oscillospiraceae bacterium]
MKRNDSLIPTGKRRKGAALAVMMTPLLIAVMALTGVLSPQNAFAAAGDGWDLNNFTKGVVIRDSAGNTLPPGGSVTAGEDYVLYISFKEKTNLQFAYNGAGRLIYQLPPNILIDHAVSNAPIIGTGASNPVIGHCDVTTGGLVTIRFENVWADGGPAPANFIEVYTNAEFEVDIMARFEGGGGFDFGNNLTLSIDVLEPQEPVGVPRITKTASAFDPAAKTVDYTVVITAENGGLVIDGFSDFVRAGSTGLGPSEIMISNVKVNGGTSGFTWSWRGAAPPGWDIAFGQALALAKDQSVAVTYTVDLTDYIDAQYPDAATANYRFTVFNTAHVDYTTAGDVQKEASVSQNMAVSHTIIGKTGTYSQADSRITWTVSAGDGLVPLGGSTITDTHGPGAVMPDLVTLTLCGQDNAALAPEITVSTTATGFSYTIPATHGSPAQEVYYVTAVYDTELEVNLIPSNGQVKNHVTIDLPGSPEREAAVSTGVAGLSAHKYAGWADEENILWTCVINIPSGMLGRQLYLSDQLQIAGVGWPVNNPGNISLTLNGIALDEEDAPLGWRFEPLAPDPSRWLILFDDSADAESSTWPLDEAAVLVVTYQIPLSTPLNHNGYATFGEYLKASPAFSLSNTMDIIVDNSISIAGPNTQINWPLHKTNTTITESGDDAIFSYQVVLNGYSLWYDLGGSDGFGGWTQQIFQSGGPAVFFDEFDERLEYVPGSFYAEKGYADYVGYGQMYSYPGGGDPAVSDGVLTADLDDLLLNGSDPDPSWYAAYDQVIYVFYQLRLPEGRNILDQIVLNNTAGFVGGGDKLHKTVNGRFTHSREVKYGTKALTKEMHADGNLAVFSIAVNPKGLRLNGGENLCVADRMSDTLMFYLTSLGAYTESIAGSGVFDAQQPLAQTPELDPDAPWTWALTGENEITLVIPDETPVKLIYEALIKGSIGEDIQIVNRVEAGMFEDIYAEEWRFHDVKASGLGSVGKFLLLKNDAKNTESFLPGARFALYIAWPAGQSWNYGNNSPPAGIPATFTLSGYTYYYLDESTTDAAGSILFENLWLTPESAEDGALFAAREIAAPPGYQMPVDPLTLVDLFSDTGTDYITLSNSPEETELTISGEKMIIGNPPAEEIPVFTYHLLRTADEEGVYPVFPMVSDTAQTSGAGQFSFPLAELGPGTAYYRVTEAPGSFGSCWSYDESVYIIRITVEVGPEGELIPAVEYRVKAEESGEWSEWSEWSESAGTAAIAFTNRYMPPGAELTISGIKTVSAAGAYAPPKTILFTIEQVNADGTDYCGGNPVCLPPPAAVETAGPGDYELSFYINGLADDLYYFRIAEIDDSGGGWQYDSAPRLAAITVSEGEITGEAYWTIEAAGNPEAAEGLCFTNTYTHGGPVFPKVGGPGKRPFALAAAALSSLLFLFLAGALTYQYRRERWLTQLE